MNAFQFIDTKFQQASVKIGQMNSQTYDLRTGGEAKALQMLLEFLRFLYKWLAVPRLIGEFLMVKVGLKAEPVSPLFPKPDAALKAVPNPDDARKQSDGEAEPRTP